MADFSHEAALKIRGFSHICGIDEVGRGPLAGPVVAAACIFESEASSKCPPELTDSKALSPKKREVLFDILTNDPNVHYALALVEPSRIDTINILQATMQAMREALVALQEKHPVDFALVDGNRLPELPIAGAPLIKGDSISASIAGASVIAKVTRDGIMCSYAERYPEYGFEKHMGYGTKAHLEALSKYGPCPIHRLSFAPCNTA